MAYSFICQCLVSDVAGRIAMQSIPDVVHRHSENIWEFSSSQGEVMGSTKHMAIVRGQIFLGKNGLLLTAQCTFETTLMFCVIVVASILSNIIHDCVILFFAFRSIIMLSFCYVSCSYCQFALGLQHMKQYANSSDWR